MNCEECGGSCCKQPANKKELKTRVPINILDLAKILRARNCEFQEYSPLIKGFGSIMINGKEAIIIRNAWGLESYLKNPCFFQKNNGLCELHKEEIEIGWLSKSAKPMVCRHHPKNYDYQTGELRECQPCNQFKKYQIIIKEEKIIKEAKIIYELQEALRDYYQITRKYEMHELARTLKIKEFIKKIDKEKKHQGISEERIHNSYTNLRQLLTNPNTRSGKKDK